MRIFCVIFSSSSIIINDSVIQCYKLASSVETPAQEHPQSIRDAFALIIIL